LWSKWLFLNVYLQNAAQLHDYKNKAEAEKSVECTKALGDESPFGVGGFVVEAAAQNVSQGGRRQCVQPRGNCAVGKILCTDVTSCGFY
jgi:hypothetical protein